MSENCPNSGGQHEERANLLQCGLNSLKARVMVRGLTGIDGRTAAAQALDELAPATADGLGRRGGD